MNFFSVTWNKNDKFFSFNFWRNRKIQKETERNIKKQREKKKETKKKQKEANRIKKEQKEAKNPKENKKKREHEANHDHFGQANLSS